LPRKREYYAENREQILQQRRTHYEENHAEIRAREKARYWADPEKVREEKRRSVAKNPEIARTRAAQWYRDNPERAREANRAWARANPEKVREYARRSHKRHHTKRRWALLDYRRRNPDVALAQKHRRKARIANNGGRGISAADIRDMRIAQDHKCAYCQRTVPLTLDHIIPVSRGGMHDPENACMACGPCNYQKQGRTPDEWTNRWYLQDDE
jgi:5-methylcytosine-specific restriction endonuclease McrA